MFGKFLVFYDMVVENLEGFQISKMHHKSTLSEKIDEKLNFTHSMLHKTLTLLVAGAPGAAESIFLRTPPLKWGTVTEKLIWSHETTYPKVPCKNQTAPE